MGWVVSAIVGLAMGGVVGQGRQRIVGTRPAGLVAMPDGSAWTQ